MHPRYFSRRFAVDYTLHASHSTLHEVQHHEAHIASVIADSGVTDRVIGAAFDGTGYGPDGNIWGGEFFIGGLAGFRRAGHLQYAAMPGGEAAIREPWRMAESLLYAAGLKAPPPIIKTMIDRNINSPLTSSAGRLFDAVASLILSKKKSSYEAELPTELERMAKKAAGRIMVSTS
jgi:hydrogenase maturation protein HypF